MAQNTSAPLGLDLTERRIASSLPAQRAASSQARKRRHPRPAAGVAAPRPPSGLRTSAAPSCYPAAPPPPAPVAAALLPALPRSLASECQTAAGRPELGFRPKIAAARAPVGSPSSSLSSHSVVSSNFTSLFNFCIVA